MGILDRFRRKKAEASDAADFDTRGVARWNPLQFRNRIFGGPWRTSPSGQGSASDLGGQVTWQPTIWNNRQPMETFYRESALAQKFTDIPIDDCFVRGWTWTSDQEEKVKKIEDEIEWLMVVPRIKDAMRAARIHGDGFLALMTMENGGDLTEPLDVDKIGPEDLKAVHAFDWFDLDILLHNGDHFHPGWSEPELFRITPTRTAEEIASSGVEAPRREGEVPGAPFDIHASRLIHFTGRTAPRTEGWTAYPEDRNAGALQLAAPDIQRHEGCLAAIAHMVQESSHTVYSVRGLEAIRAGASTADMSLEQTVETMLGNRSIYRTSIIDERDKLERLNLPLSNFKELADLFLHRVASAADIPISRFEGSSPAGFQSTGESEMKNWAIAVKGRQEALTPMLQPLFDVLAKSLGLNPEEDMDFEWCSLIDQSDEEQATLSELQAKTVTLLTTPGILDENEAREILSKNEFFGELPALPEDQLAKNQEDEIPGGFGSGGGMDGDNMRSSQKPAEAQEKSEE